MPERHAKSAARDTFESLIVTVILAIFGATFVVEAFKIPTGSMKNTLLVGDHPLVNKFEFAYPRGPLSFLLPYRRIHRDDIIVFRYPGPREEALEPGEYFVKRVIGLPGDRIKIVNRQVYVNGKAVPQPFVRNTHPNEVLSGDNFPPSDPNELFAGGGTTEWVATIENYVHDGQLVVPPGEYFVMGDNREASWDSRFWGFVPRDLISGRPIFNYWSYETSSNAYKETSLGGRFKQIFSLVIHFFTRTRWRRTFPVSLFHMVR